MLTNKFLKLAVLFALFMLFIPVSAQTKKNNRTNKTAKPAEQVEPPKSVEPEPTPPPAGKKNSRPNADQSPVSGNSGDKKPGADKKPAFVYEFSQPQFVISHIRIEHDESGKGKISFMKKDFDEEYTDPIQLSETTLEKLKTSFAALNFLDSTEDYQFEKDFSHLGNMKITRRDGERERTSEFNWTTNENAKTIVGEYRKISNQYIWLFDISVARENQPLESPRIMKALDSYLKRNEISDPFQMIPFLKDLSDDERIPLIARNNATRLIKEIEKKKKD